MTRVPPPNAELADLAAALGEDNVRSLVRTFLRDFPTLIHDLGAGERKDRYRIAHSMKSNSRLMGAHQLSRRMAELEKRLASEHGPDVAAEDIAAVQNEYAAIVEPLKAFAGQ